MWISSPTLVNTNQSGFVKVLTFLALTKVEYIYVFTPGGVLIQMNPFALKPDHGNKQAYKFWAACGIYTSSSLQSLMKEFKYTSDLRVWNTEYYSLSMNAP